MNGMVRKLKTPAAIIIACALFAAAGRVQHRLLRPVATQRADEPGAWENAPPMVAVTAVVLGAFRGLVVDLLWLRLSELQDRGKYLEIAQLADWITRLEPHCTDIWTFHAWNMAYNISVMLSNHEDRWRWVKSAADLLCRDALRYNPTDADLHAEIAWLFQYKIGAFADRAHETYKRRLAADMTMLLGSGTPDYSALAKNPRRVELLRRAYALDPRLMQTLDEKWGPLDWRLPETLAVYWAWKGLPYADDQSLRSCHRIIYQSMTAMVLRGKLFFDPESGRYEAGPDLDRYPHAVKAYEAAIAACPTDQNMRTALSIFLDRAIIILVEQGRLEDAADALGRLRSMRAVVSETDPATYAEAARLRLAREYSGTLPGLDKPLK